jgi:hypothetical protein
LEHTDHPLAIEQRNGITMQRVQEIAECVLHTPTQSNKSLADDRDASQTDGKNARLVEAALET